MVRASRNHWEWVQQLDSDYKPPGIFVMGAYLGVDGNKAENARRFYFRRA